MGTVDGKIICLDSEHLNIMRQVDSSLISSIETSGTKFEIDHSRSLILLLLESRISYYDLVE